MEHREILHPFATHLSLVILHNQTTPTWSCLPDSVTTILSVWYILWNIFRWAFSPQPKTLSVLFGYQYFFSFLVNELPWFICATSLEDIWTAFSFEELPMDSLLEMFWEYYIFIRISSNCFTGWLCYFTSLAVMYVSAGCLSSWTITKVNYQTWTFIFFQHKSCVRHVPRTEPIFSLFSSVED